MKDKENLGCYIICRMYAGEYISGKNIGHEVINLFRADDGNNYIYVNPGGLINPKYDNKVKGVLLVRKADSIHRLEVLGIAKLDENSQMAYSSTIKDRDERIKELNRISEEKVGVVKYGGVNHNELFRKNTYQGAEEDFHVITFRAKKMLLPKKGKKVYIADTKYNGGADCCLKSTIFPSISLRQYIDNSEKLEDYELITKLVSDKNLWSDNQKCEMVEEPEKMIASDNEYNYLDIIRRKDDENVFSNLIEHFLNNDPKLFKDFCTSVLKIEDLKDGVEVEREKYVKGPRIDLYFEDDHYAVVIENKIMSGINSKSSHPLRTGKYAGKYNSQLSDYYKFAEKHEVEKHKLQKYDPKCYILSPDYHDVDCSDCAYGDEYTSIKYSKLLDFFEKHEYSNKKEAKYYDDFIRALRRHAKDYYDDQYEEMKRRFLYRIIECKND